MLSLAAAVSLAVPAAARADELLVGALRDQDGQVVAGAAVTALDAGGRVLARDRSAPDGTFAVTTAERPAAILIVAPDADPLRLAAPPPGSPLAAVVRRHRAADLVPAPADVAALPAGSLSAVASVLPYRVAFPSTIADRWLSDGRSVVTVEGLPFYRRGDGGDTTGLLPSHSFGAVGVRDTLQAPWYGDRAGGGTIDARLFDRSDAVRATSTDAALFGGANPAAVLATSWDADGARRLAAAHGVTALGPYSAEIVALVGSAPGAHYAGAGVDVRTATRMLDVGAHVGLTLDDASTNATRDDGSVADVALDASARGPNAIAVRARWRDERGSLGIADEEHHDAALVFGTARGNALHASAALAFAYGDEHSYELGTQTGTAILPSLSLDAPIGAGWSIHAGARGASLGTPGYAIAHSSLGEAALSYADRRRLRAEIIAYTEGNLAPASVNRGFAAALGWEVAPRVSLRVWTLRDADALEAFAPQYPGGPVQTVRVGEPFNRDVVWLTWDAPVRFDVLVRSGALEGNLRVPLGARYALTLGSFVRSDATRAFTFGLTAR